MEEENVIYFDENIPEEPNTLEEPIRYVKEVESEDGRMVFFMKMTEEEIAELKAITAKRRREWKEMREKKIAQMNKQKMSSSATETPKFMNTHLPKDNTRND